MSKWIMRVWIGLILAYIAYIAGAAAIHTFCDCLK